MDFLARELGMPMEKVYGYVEKKVREEQARNEGHYVPRESEPTRDYGREALTQQQEAAQKLQEADVVLRSDFELQRMKQDYEGRMGTGEFNRLLWSEGQRLESTQGRYVPVFEAMQAVKTKLSQLNYAQPASQNLYPTQGVPQMMPQQPQMMPQQPQMMPQQPQMMPQQPQMMPQQPQMMPQQPQMMPQQPQMMPQQPGGIIRSPKQTLPSIRSKTTAKVKKAPKSLDEMVKMADTKGRTVLA